MKQIWKGVMALATLLLAVACAPEEQRRAPEGDTNVTFNVTAPVNELGPGTRAMGDGTTATKLTVAVYDAAGNLLPDLTINKDFVKQTVVELTLVTGKEYQIVFWAQSEAAPYAYDLENAQLDITYEETLKANNESLDAFWHMEKYTVEGAASESVKLLRPFAQLNVATSDYDKAVSAGVTIKQSKMKVENVYNTMNMLTGEVGGETSVALAMNNTPKEQGEALAKYEDRAWLGMGYFLVGEKILVKTTFETEINDVAVKAWDNIPLQRNYRTNILGNLLTSTVDFNVVVDEVFAGAMDTTIWDGKSVKEPAKVKGKYQITDPAELAWLSAATNGTLGTESAPYTKGETTTPEAMDFAGETFVLTKDIDLLGNKWTPIGSVKTFMGTFDGQGYTISNLNVRASDKSAIGLFSKARNVKNVNVKGAEIVGHYKAGVIVGDGLCAKIENCHVEDAIVTIVPLNKDDANHAGGIVGYLCGDGSAAYAYVKNSSVKNAQISAFRDVAGIAGCANNSDGGTVEVSNNTVENVTITADQTVEYISNEKDGNAAAVAGRLGSKAEIKDNTVGEEVVVIRKVDTSKEMEYAVADAQSGDCIYVGGEVTMPYFTDKALNFEGITKDAVVKQSPATHIDEFYKGAELNFKGLTLVGTSYTNNTQGYQKSVKETYTDCHFENYIMFAGDVTIVTNCTFENEGQYFWTATADDITFNNCKFNGTERAVKVCTVGNNGERVVTFNKCEFKAETQVKAAIEIDGTKGSSYIVNINNCTETGFAPGEFTDMTMFNVEGPENVQVYLDGKKFVRNGVMEKDGELFAYNVAGLQWLLDNAKDGETVKISADIEGDVTVTQKADVKITIEGNDYKYAGVILVDGKSATLTTAGVTIKNLNFEAEEISADAIIRLGNGTNATRYACNVAVEGCSFNVPGAVAVKSYTGGDKNLSIKDCTGTGIHSLLQVKNIEGITIEDVTINGGRGASFGQSSNIVVKNSSFVAETYGLRVDASVEATLDIENVSIDAKLPIVARKTSKNYTINLAGANTLTANGYQVVFTTGDDEASFVAPAEYTLTGADGLRVFPRDAEEYNYAYNAADIQAALSEGDDVVLTDDVVIASSEVNSNNYGKTGISQTNGGTIDGNGKDFGAEVWGTWDSAINTTGGTIKNINITKGFRGIFINHNSTNCSKVYLENVTIDGPTYTISCDQGTNNGLEATNSTFKGWTSYAATLGNAKFTDCYFGEGAGYSFCRPYAPTEFVGCAFEAGFRMDAQAAVTFENCTIGGVALTAENLATLVVSNIANASVK